MINFKDSRPSEVQVRINSGETEQYLKFVMPKNTEVQ